MGNILIRITAVFLLSLFCFGVSFGQEPQVVTVEGMADIVAGDPNLAKQRAIEDAKRRAVEKSLGTIVASETLVRNYQLVNDQILTKAGGFVKRYQLLSESTTDGLYRVLIEAEVTEILDEVVRDQVALDLLLAWVGRPVLMIVVEEDNLGDRSSRVVETEMIKLFAEKGFDLVDRAQVERIRESDRMKLALAGDKQAAAAIGAEFGAQLVITGQARASTGGKIYNMISGQADLTARAIRTDTADILAATTAHGAKPHISATTAATNALIDAGQQMADYLLQEIVKRWSTEAVGTTKVELLVSGVDYLTLVKLEKELMRVPGVKDVNRKSFIESVARLDIRYQGKADQLAILLAKRELRGFSLMVTGTTPHRIDLEVVPIGE